MANKYSIKSELYGTNLERLLELMEPIAHSALLVIRDGLSLSKEGQRKLDILSEFLWKKRRGNTWPGTELIDEQATIFEYHYNSKFRKTLFQLSDRLYSWQQPDSPEDFCLLKWDSSIALGTIAHEKDAFLVLTGEEYQSIIKAIPEFESIVVAD